LRKANYFVRLSIRMLCVNNIDQCRAERIVVPIQRDCDALVFLKTALEQ
jgi:hypothetical protein